MQSASSAMIYTSIVNYYVGLYLLNPKVLNLIPKNTFFHMTNLLKEAKKKKLSVGVYPIADKEWIDVGQWSNYKKLIKE